MSSGDEHWHIRPPVDTNPIVFLDISIGGTAIGRMKLELWADVRFVGIGPAHGAPTHCTKFHAIAATGCEPVCPKTSENFRKFCTGEYVRTGVPQGYKDCSFHRIERDFIIQGGDFVRGDGTGVMSIYDGHFADENFVARHSGPGLLSMANSGRDQNGCQFFLTCAATPHLDGKHVVFGRVLEDGLKLVRKIEHVSTDRDKKPRMAVTITQCGEM